MDTVIGFAFGYWVGTRQGREGMQQALEAMAGPVRDKLRHA